MTDTTSEMRSRIRKVRKPRKTFMRPEDARSMREVVLRATQAALAEQLDDPDTGEPISTATISRWESGVQSVPLWAARRIRKLAAAAREYDKNKNGEQP